MSQVSDCESEIKLQLGVWNLFCNSKWGSLPQFKPLSKEVVTALSLGSRNNSHSVLSLSL